MGTPEHAVKKALDAYLKTLNAYVFAPVQSGRGRRTVDRLACLCGHFWGIEAKAPGEKPTALQLKILKDIKAVGGVAAIVTLDGKRLVWEFL